MKKEMSEIVDYCHNKMRKKINRMIEKIQVDLNSKKRRKRQIRKSRARMRTRKSN